MNLLIKIHNLWFEYLKFSVAFDNDKFGLVQSLPSIPFTFLEADDPSFPDSHRVEDASQVRGGSPPFP